MRTHSMHSDNRAWRNLVAIARALRDNNLGQLEFPIRTRASELGHYPLGQQDQIVNLEHSQQSCGSPPWVDLDRVGQGDKSIYVRFASKADMPSLPPPALC